MAASMTGGAALTWSALVVASAAAGYGSWRFWSAFRLTGSGLSLVAAVVSIAAPSAAVALASAGPSPAIQAGPPAVGAVAIVGFGLSRTRWLAPLSLGLWLPSALASWREGNPAPLDRLLASALGRTGAAHASRTAALAQALAESLGVPGEEIDDLVLAALLHAIGGPLDGSADECPPSPRHACRAASALRQVPASGSVPDTLAALCERWDGSGPTGLAGESLPLSARIIAAAEAFDLAALSGPQAARAALHEGSGLAFDPVVVGEILHLHRTD